MMANWTRGVAVAHIRASGPVGRHTIEAADAISFKYLNIQQSPIPWGTGYLMSFNVTKDNGRPKAQIDWPANVAPTLDAKTTLQLNATSSASTATAQLASTSGAVNSQVAITAGGLTRTRRSISSGRPSSATGSTAPARAGRSSRCRSGRRPPQPTAP